MKLLSPISRPEETEELIKAGADELYCGLLPDGWKDSYTSLAAPNRREYSRANLSNWAQLKKVIDCASKYSVKVVLALNVSYTEEQYPLVLEQTKKAASLGISGLIVSDVGLLSLLNNQYYKIPLYISTLGNVFNSGAVEFFKSLGAKRITLPWYLSPGEIKRILLKNPGMEFEVFILNDACRNVDGFCTFMHGTEELEDNSCKPELFFRSLSCNLNYKVSLTENSPTHPQAESLIEKIKTGFGLSSVVNTCGACLLKEFKEWGISGVKIAGRQYPIKVKIKSTFFIKTLLSYIDEENPNQDAFSIYAQELFRKIYRSRCKGFCAYLN